MDINTNYGVASALASTTNSSANTSTATSSANTTAAESASSTTNANSAAVYEPSSQAASGGYKVDKEKIQQLVSEANDKTKQFADLVRKLISKQADKNAVANGVSKEEATNSLMNSILNGDAMVEVDAETRAAAQEAIGEDGYYGVKQTTERIMDFAKAIAGDDPEKLEKMREAVEKGFKEAERLWGGELPQISKDTYAAVMKEFDELTGKNK